jgi:hypothetical protein
MTRPDYDGLLGNIADMLAAARRASARAVNALMTATYWEIGRRIVEFEQGGAGGVWQGTAKTAINGSRFPLWSRLWGS